jgi:hypothetical protein
MPYAGNPCLPDQEAYSNETVELAETDFFASTLTHIISSP